MKRTILILISAVILVFSACSGESKENADSTSHTLQTIGNITQSTYASETSTSETAESNEKTTKKETKTTKNTSKTSKNKVKNSTTATIYELRINYKNMADFKKKIQSYKTFAKLMKSVDTDENNACVNPFMQQNLNMIFEDKKAFAPILPDGYKLKSCSLSSKDYFDFQFTDEDKKVQSLIIYTKVDNDALKTSKFILSFMSEQGIDIYKNSDKKYCWYLDDKYIVIYSGTDKNFINDLYFETIYVQ